MKATIYSTSKIVMIKPSPLAEGVPARIWEGMTQSGIKIHCYITRVATDINEPNMEEFEKELQECTPPSAELSIIPSRMIL